MKNSYKTKKNKKYYKNNSLKTYKGGENETANTIMNQIKQKNQMHLPSLGTSGVITNVKNIAQGSAINAVDKLGEAVGVDLTDPIQTQQKLEQIKSTISNPETIAKVKEILGMYAQYGSVALEAVEPFIEKLSNVVIKEGSKTAESFINTGSTVLGNVIKEIPGVGLVASIAQDAEKIGETVASVVNTGSTIAEELSDTTNASIQNYNKLVKEKEDLLQRTNNSLTKFENPLQNMSSNVMQNVNSNINSSVGNLNNSLNNKLNNSLNKVITGGNKRTKRIKHRNRSKRV